MKLIVGLGNPGSEYEKTKHNIGFMFLDRYANKYNLKINNKKFNGEFVKTSIKNNDVILLKPLSYMNLSGEVVRRFVDYYKIDISDILIISDDLDLNFLNIKLKSSGSSGGHNGLKNIELNLASNKYKRLKIGISNNKCIDTKDYVLGKFNSKEIKSIDELSLTINNILDDFFDTDFNIIMSKYNIKNR